MTYLTLRNNEHATYQQDLNRLFGDFWALPSQQKQQQAAWAPHADIDEEEAHYTLSLDLPGLAKEDLAIEVSEDQVVVSGERKAPEKRGLYSERRYGKFQRTFTLPTHVDTAKIEAKFEQGVLRVKVPKAESAKPRQVKID
jgi:HSP20 family protein